MVLAARQVTLAIAVSNDIEPSSTRRIANGSKVSKAEIPGSVC